MKGHTDLDGSCRDTNYVSLYGSVEDFKTRKNLERRFLFKSIQIDQKNNSTRNQPSFEFFLFFSICSFDFHYKEASLQY